MLKKILLAVLVLALSMWIFSCTKKDTGKIVIATDATWPPMEYIDTNKNIVGFDIDLMNLAAEEGGFEVEFRNTAWDGIWAGLASKEYDAVMSSVTITEERKATMDFSVPYINAGQVLIVQTAASGVSGLKDLGGKSVGAQLSTTGAIEIKKFSDIDLKEYDEVGMAIEDLVNGRIAGVVADSPTAANFVLQNDSYKGKLKIVGEPFTEEFYGVAVDKGNNAVLDKINNGFNKVLNTPKVQALKDKWLKAGG